MKLAINSHAVNKCSFIVTWSESAELIDRITEAVVMYSCVKLSLPEHNHFSQLSPDYCSFLGYTLHFSVMYCSLKEINCKTGHSAASWVSELTESSTIEQKLIMMLFTSEELRLYLYFV